MSEGQGALPLLRLGRLELGPGLRALQPGAASGLVVTAMIEVPDSGSERQYAWEVAWSDAAREFLDPPRGKDVDAQLVLDLRRMLSSAGYRPS